MNSYRELLAVDENALEEMQALASESTWPYDDNEDIDLIRAELARVERRLRFWEDMVDGANWRLRKLA